MALPPGHRYVSGSNRKQVENVATGERMDRQKAMNLNAQRYGFRTEHQMRKWSSRVSGSDRVVNAWEGVARDSTGARLISRAELNAYAGALAHEYDRAKGLATDYGGEPSDYLSKDPNGPLANYLAAIGRRDFSADYGVGDTPSTKN